MENTIEQNIDTVIFSLLEIKKKIKEAPKESPCYDCNKLKENCKKVDETNSEYFKLNKKYIALKEKYEPTD
ncbi:34458_t:CDS:2 [Racocetra persica]|uniref:34458_t:CDS:1 n=1 Tax=Racocetra persica TaxID=160502 RepID=A0ACA9KT59_9GLOM|nr:34458_t:CDS:2 [Racocetra persica]